ncbi:MAG: iron-sulfur cluster assembly accessory protein [Alphaproteobacteria bacterium]|nr:MAG: iron-sulfur cluster assembly accessory protein [Alphaproteobacteria bacterium]
MGCSNDTSSKIDLEEIVNPVLSNKAAEVINSKFNKYEEKEGIRPIGIKINVVREGCAGLGYGMEYVFKSEDANSIESNGIKLFMNDEALQMLSHATIDYHVTESASGFVFNNPNEQCKCACGKSFSA